jgi:hypothetical protein
MKIEPRATVLSGDSPPSPGGSSAGPAPAAPARRSTTPPDGFEGAARDPFRTALAACEAGPGELEPQAATPILNQLRVAASELAALADEQLPAGLPAAELATETEYNHWLRATAGRLADLADRWEQAIATAPAIEQAAEPQRLVQATKQLQETEMSFNLQYLQLQSQMQHENRAYTAISNIMKTKHDTVKNSISNIR